MGDPVPIVCVSSGSDFCFFGRGLYELCKPYKPGYKPLVKCVQTVQTVKERKNRYEVLIFSYGLYGLYVNNSGLYTGLQSLYDF